MSIGKVSLPSCHFSIQYVFTCVHLKQISIGFENGVINFADKNVERRLVSTKSVQAKNGRVKKPKSLGKHKFGVSQSRL